MFIRNIHEEAQEDDILDLFSEYGDVKNIALNLDRRTGYVKVYIYICTYTYVCTKFLYFLVDHLFYILIDHNYDNDKEIHLISSFIMFL